ncbi:hypothetical protein T484DRAFT_1741990 [Baffinella frigidus]|nr:hypothetical protein T484DRAFT_1741990 [Cryptophyta sp. CCMP2293]
MGGMHADMEAQRFCEYLYQAIILMFAVPPPLCCLSRTSAQRFQSPLPHERLGGQPPACPTCWPHPAGGSAGSNALSRLLRGGLGGETVVACARPGGEVWCERRTLIRLVGQVMGFIGGYWVESFRVTVYAVFGGVIISSAICVPDFGIFKGA